MKLEDAVRYLTKIYDGAKADGHVARWPKLARAWEKAVKATFQLQDNKVYQTPDEYWQWWLDRDRKALSNDENQCMLMFED
jgi:hypothetical protein